jgi:hypothetical protein
MMRVRIPEVNLPELSSYKERPWDGCTHAAIKRCVTAKVELGGMDIVLFVGSWEIGNLVFLLALNWYHDGTLRRKCMESRMIIRRAILAM